MPFGDEQAELEALEIARNKVEGLAVEQVSRHDLPLNFTANTPDIRRALRLFELVEDLDFDGVPKEQIRGAAKNLRGLADLLESMARFRPPEGPGDRQARDEMAGALSGRVSQAANAVLPLLVFGVRIAQRDGVHSSEFQDLLDRGRRTLDQTQRAQAESESILQSIKATAAEAAVSEQAKFFDSARRQHQVQSRIWLGMALFFATLTIGFAWLVWSQDPPGADAGHVVRYITTRLIALSVLIAGVGWSAKNYRASRHNEVVNAHRALALRTFQSFASAASDKQVKDAVLLQATQAIFSGQASGFLGEDADSVPQTSTIVEVLRKFGPESKP